MAFQKRVYRVTDAGVQALADAPAWLLYPCRRILGLLQGETHFAVIRAGMGMCDEAQIGHWLNQLETRGLVSSQADQVDSDLDFTGSFSLAAIKAGHNAG